MTLVEPSWADARTAAHSAGVRLAVEHVPLVHADRRTLAADVTALTPLPAFATSAMDGWAVADAGPWEVVGQVLAGQTWRTPLFPGQAVLIATGAAVPDGTTGVLRREWGTEGDGGRVVGPPIVPGQDIRPAGEEAAEGDVLLDAGTLLTPAHAGLAAAAGADTLPVVRHPTARLLVLGDELLESGPARDGRVRDSLGPQVPAWLSRFGVLSMGMDRVPDTLAAHVAALEAAREDVHLVVTTGGTAAGPVDHLHQALAATGGQLVVDTVAVRPGHPMLLGRWPGNHWLLGLPGNPQSAVVALLTLGAPLVDALLGRPLARLPEVALAQAVTAPARETRLVLSRLEGDQAQPGIHLGSGMLRGLATAHGFAVVPPAGVRAGHRVGWLALPG